MYSSETQMDSFGFRLQTNHCQNKTTKTPPKKPNPKPTKSNPQTPKKSYSATQGNPSCNPGSVTDSNHGIRQENCLGHTINLIFTRVYGKIRSSNTMMVIHSIKALIKFSLFQFHPN